MPGTKSGLCDGWSKISHFNSSSSVCVSAIVWSHALSFRRMTPWLLSHVICSYRLWTFFQSFTVNICSYSVLMCKLHEFSFCLEVPNYTTYRYIKTGRIVIATSISMNFCSYTNEKSELWVVEHQHYSLHLT